MRILYVWIFFISVNVPDLLAQDAQFSQFYAAPLYLNPAFAGSNNRTRIGLNNRIQWASFDRSFDTQSVFVDYFTKYLSGGLGIVITRNKESLLGFKSTEVGGMYSYNLRFKRSVYMRTGLQYTRINKSVDFDRLIFGDQIDLINGVYTDRSGEVLDPTEMTGFGSWSFGSLIYGSFWSLGIAIHHLNEPNQSFLNLDSKLNSKLSIHASFMETLQTTIGKVSSTYAINYKTQGGFDQLDLSAQWLLKNYLFSLRYRGGPVKGGRGIRDADALIFMLGAKINKREFTDVLSVAYSYDMTISKLSGSGGSHEISLIVDLGRINKFYKRDTIIPCPKL